MKKISRNSTAIKENREHSLHCDKLTYCIYSDQYDRSWSDDAGL